MGGKGGKLVSLLIFFTAAVWCVPFSGAVGLFNKLQTQKTNLNSMYTYTKLKVSGQLVAKQRPVTP